MSALPDEAIEAAARASEDLIATQIGLPPCRWDALPAHELDQARDVARAALSAAAPFIEAAVIERVVAALRDEGDRLWTGEQAADFIEHSFLPEQSS